jgi:acetyl-CoA carboxylase carboxyltransferase component
MVKDRSAMFVAGPPVVERLGQKLTKNELGGWQIQLAGGGRHAVDTEEEAFALRAALSLVHAVVDRRRAAARPVDRRPRRREEWLFDAIPRDPRKPYKMRAIVEAVVDRGSFSRSRALRPAVITGSRGWTAGRWR